MNRSFLAAAVKHQPREKLAAGLLLFVAYRRLLDERCGDDFLAMLPHAAEEDVRDLLLHFKGEHVRLQLEERRLKSTLGRPAYMGLFRRMPADPLALRLACCIAILVITAFLDRTARSSSLALLRRIEAAAAPHLS